jgi:CheY-like chemotaxis protein
VSSIEETALVVDDDDAAQEIASCQLQAFGYSCSKASSGKEA